MAEIFAQCYCGGRGFNTRRGDFEHSFGTTLNKITDTQFLYSDEMAALSCTANFSVEKGQCDFNSRTSHPLLALPVKTQLKRAALVQISTFGYKPLSKTFFVKSLEIPRVAVNCKL